MTSISLFDFYLGTATLDSQTDRDSTGRNFLPRNKRHGALATKDKTDSPSLDLGYEDTTVTTATANDAASATADDDDDDAVTFPLESSPAPEDYKPNRKSPGRTRRPSYFDDILRDPSVYDQGYQMVPVTSEDHKAFVKREIDRAKLYLNSEENRPNGEPEIGISYDLDKDDAVYYRVREAQKRTRKAKDADGNVIEVEDDTDDNDETDND